MSFLKITPIALIVLIFASCSNEVEIITNPKNGKLLLKYEYYLDDSGQKIKDGEYFKWSDNGDLEEEAYFEDNQFQGIRKLYFYDRSFIVWNYDNGLKSGESTVHSNDGSIIRLFQYKDDLLEGKQIFYRSKDKPQLLAYYEKGISQGKWEYFNGNGKMIGTLNFENGICQELIGEWTVESKPGHKYILNNDGKLIHHKPQSWFSPVSDNYEEGTWKMGEKLTFVLPGVIESEPRTILYEIVSFDSNIFDFKNPLYDYDGKALFTLKRVDK